jgi:hypothetical protein
MSEDVLGLGKLLSDVELFELLRYYDDAEIIEAVVKWAYPPDRQVAKRLELGDNFVEQLQQKLSAARKESK